MVQSSILKIHKYSKIIEVRKRAKIRNRYRERSGSMVECLTRDRRAAGSSLTGDTALWSLSKTTFILAKYLFNPGRLVPI